LSLVLYLGFFNSNFENKLVIKFFLNKLKQQDKDPKINSINYGEQVVIEVCIFYCYINKI